MTTTSRIHWWISVALLMLCGLMAMVFWGPRESLAVVPRRPEDRNFLRVAYAQYLLPDPHRRTLPFPTHNHFILSLWEPLVECDPATGQPQPAAAESWEWSADRLTLTLKLRPDARWSNGDPVTAHDFVRSWLRLLRQRMELAQTLFMLKNAEAYHLGRLSETREVGVHAIDNLTLRLELAQIRSTLVAELADPLLSPLHYTSEKVLADGSYFYDPARLTTNGPFRLVQANYDGFRLEVCEYYHGRAGIRLTGAEFIRVDNLAIAPLLLAAGVVDMVSPAAYGGGGEMPTNRQVTRKSELVLAVSSLDFNVTRGPLRDIRVRQALALALDRAGTIKKYDTGRLVPAWSWVPDMPGREGLVLLKEDADEARRLLATAGYPGGKGFPVLNMALTIGSSKDPYPSAWTERWFQELGVKTHISYEPMPVRAQRLMAGDYDVLYGTLIATVPDAGDLLGGFLWPAEYSNTKWIDQEMIHLLNEANTKMGPERLEVLEKAERLAMAAVPTVPVTFTRRQAMLAAEVQGWYADPLGRQSIKRLWLAHAPASNSNPEPKL